VRLTAENGALLAEVNELRRGLRYSWGELLKARRAAGLAPPPPGVVLSAGGIPVFTLQQASAELARARAVAGEGAANAAATAGALRKDKEMLERFVRAVERAGARAGALRSELDAVYARNAAVAVEVEAAGKARARAGEECARSRAECERVKKLCALAEGKTREAEAAAREIQQQQQQQQPAPQPPAPGAGAPGGDAQLR
jgi:hypothetical protein